MKKFNGFENWFLHTAILHAVEEAEADVIEAEKSGENLIFAKGYFTSIGKDLRDKIDAMTTKSAIKERERLVQERKKEKDDNNGQVSK